MSSKITLDTNFFINNPKFMSEYSETLFIVPFIVLEELDGLKKTPGVVGKNARESIRMLDEVRKLGNLSLGIKLPQDNNSIIVYTLSSLSSETMDLKKPDNYIIGVAHETESLLATLDLALRVKAESLGIKVLELEENTIDLHKLYSGNSDVFCSNSLIEKLYESKSVEIKNLKELTLEELENVTLSNEELLLESKDKRLINFKEERSIKELKEFFIDLGSNLLFYYNNSIYYLSIIAEELFPVNHFIKLTNHQDNKHTALTRINEDATKLELVRSKFPSLKRSFRYKPRNKEQVFALEALLNPEISIVTLVGRAGSGKTLAAIVAGLEQTLDNNSEAIYNKLIVSRPIQPLGKDLGFLPGTIQEKMAPWIAPIEDNFEHLFGSRDAFHDQVNHGKIEVEAITYIRGRTISQAFMIIDEAQNLTIHELKTILTRVGEGTKVVLTGDIEQIDNLYVDRYNNGLTYAIEKFKHQPISAHVTLEKGERSELATIAAEIL